MSVTVEQARAAAATLPEVTEQDHHGIASFRVRGKIFATVPDDQHLRVMAGEAEIRAAVAEEPAAFHEFYWGKRLACLVVDLTAASVQQLRELLTEAWLRKAPRSLARQLDSPARDEK
ncbi:MAG: MmcQ/YjbR family DNA-binding protein [Jatrophihabitantaceae bacterium]